MAERCTKKCDKDFHVKVAEKPESVRYILIGQHDFQKISPLLVEIL